MLYTVDVELKATVRVQIEANTAEEASESSHDAAIGLITADPNVADWFDTTTVDITPRD